MNKTGTTTKWTANYKGAANYTHQKGHQTREEFPFCIFSFERDKSKACEEKADRIPQPLTQ